VCSRIPLTDGQRVSPPRRYQIASGSLVFGLQLNSKSPTSAATRMRWRPFSYIVTCAANSSAPSSPSWCATSARERPIPSHSPIFMARKDTRRAQGQAERPPSVQSEDGHKHAVRDDHWDRGACTAAHSIQDVLRL